jgi:hypothetical protein
MLRMSQALKEGWRLFIFFAVKRAGDWEGMTPSMVADTCHSIYTGG